MWKVVVKGLRAHKLRLALTALAIVLGVTFISGTFVLTDTLHNTFTTLFGQVYQNVSFEIRGQAELGTQAAGNAERNPVPQSILAAVRHIPGIAYADGSVGGYAQFVAPNGKAIVTGGAPTLGLSFDPDRQLSSLRLVEGGAPTNADDVVMDQGTATKYHFVVGDRVRVLLAGPPQTFTLTGIVTFGTADNLAGATLAAFYLPTAQILFNEAGHYDSINVLAKPGANKTSLERAIAGVLPRGVEVVTGQTVANEQASAINGDLSFFSTALLVFAFISLFVGGFTIFNTFSITVGQRTRELALLRIVGASRRQIFRSVLGEAVLVGLASSLLGLGLGVLAAVGLEALLRGFGITLPSGALVFEARTVVVAIVVGVGVTVVSAVSPARRAVRIPPVAALVVYRQDNDESLRRRVVAGGIVAIGGVALLLVGLTLPQIAVVGLGALGVFIGTGMLAPIVARPMSSAIGRPLARALGISGKLGRENSMRSPRRTAQTSSALMVGLALVATIAVFGASLSKSATSSIDNAISAGYIVTSSGSGGSGEFSNSVAAAASGVPGVKAVSIVYSDQFEFRGALSYLTAVSPVHLADTIILDLTAGQGAPALAAGQLLIDTTTANTKHLSVGSIVRVKFPETGFSTLRVGGVFKANSLLGSFVISDALFRSNFNNPLPVAVLVSTARGTSNIGTALGRGLRAYPNLKIQTRAQFVSSQKAQVNQLLGLVYALLALAVIIALVGIVNTLLLSVFERTHEIGLLRAVGMKRRQVRAMIRSESVIIASFGAIVGVIIGTGLGIALVASLRNQGLSDTVIPYSSLVVFLVLSALLGLAAASWPARRAAKLDVLAAIAAE